MLTWYIRRRLAAFERAHGYDLGYARELLATDLRAFLAFARASGLGAYRRDVALAPYVAAKLVAAMAEDCGPCTQLVVTLALADGVEPAILAAILAGDVGALPADVVLAVRFARATLARAPEADLHREEILARWGARGLVSLAFAVVAGRFYPTLKYALGHGRTCQRVRVAEREVAVGHAAAPAATVHAHRP
ncbi:MAG: hypothetical protein KJZ91_17780 [Myxococcales bacterium]|nr:hypothetical protein [Myxococcales bacterium]